MRVLAVETASPEPAIALLERASAAPHEGDLLDVAPLGARAAESLARQVLLLLSRRGVPLRRLDRIAVLTGPGSFTGLRAGAAFARGLARALGIPLLGFPTFEAISPLFPDPADADFLLDAGRGEVHRASRRAGSLVGPVLVHRDEAVRQAREAGVPLLDVDVLSPPFASSLARLAADAEAASADRLAAPLGYGRPSAAEERFGPPGPGKP